jgi:sec-independent protein translocase protein TatA
MFSGLGVPELIIIFLIILVLFGANKVPKIAKDLGGGIREFKKSISGESGESGENEDDQKK